ncbi:MAG: PAS domain-containing protein, partial [Candidatus Thorarchaeota archaeon]
MTTQDDPRLLSIVLENAPTLIIMASTEGEILYVNKKAFGLSQSDLRGKSIHNFMTEEYQDDFRVIITEVIETQNEKQFEFREGEGTWVRLRIGPVVEKGEVVSLVFTSSQITEQIWAKEELHRRDEMLRSLFDESPEGISLINEDGTIIEWNKAQEDIFKLARTDAIGKKAWDIQYNFLQPERKSQISLESLRDSILGFLKTGNAPWVQKVQENTIFLRDEEEVIIQQYSAPIKSSQGYLLCSFVHDITEKRIAEINRDKADLRYHSLFDLNNDAVFILDLEGNHLDVNQRAAEILGYSRHELIGLSYRDVIVDREQNDSKRKLEEIRQVERYEIYERIVKRKDGTEIPVEVNISLVKDSDGRPLHIQSILRDISERKRAEKELIQSEKKFRELADTSLQGIQIMQESNVAYVNPAYAQLVGRSLEEIYSLDNQGLWDIIHPDDREAIGERVREYSKTGQLEPSNRYRIIRPDGEVRWVEASVSIIEFDGKPAMQRTLIDITEGVRAEEALKEERDRAEMYLQMAGVIFLVLDEKGNITLINRKGTEVLGYSQDELVGTCWFDYIAPSTREQVRANFEQLIEGRINSIEYIERNLISKKGEERLIAWHTAVLRDADGNPIGVISSGEDITEKRAAQLELRKSQDMLQLVINNIPQYVFWKDTESHYLGCNEVFAMNAGLQSSKEIVGMSDFELPWRTSEAEAFLEVDRRVLNGSFTKYDNFEKMRKADGTDAWFRTIKVPLTDVGNNIIGVLGTSEDVTEKRYAEIELARSEKKFRTLLQSLDDLVFVFDEEGRYAEYYTKNENELYVPPSEFIG